MASVNKAIVIGNLGNQPELKKYDEDKSFCAFSVATTEKFRDEETVEWHRVEVWGKQADVCAKYLSKGSAVYVEGLMKTHTWKNSNGTEKTRHFIQASVVKFITLKEKVEKHNVEDKKQEKEI